MQVGIADPQMPSGVDVNVVRMTEAVHNWYGEAAEYTLFCLLPLSSAKPMSSEWQCWESYIGFPNFISWTFYICPWQFL